ncbi:hypothetical protein SUS17_1797 [Sphingomonas sp. S17]|nr:hypothetical protein SUS17_1797 [Sphingomonas sp. S17]
MAEWRAASAWIRESDQLEPTLGQGIGDDRVFHIGAVMRS